MSTQYITVEPDMKNEWILRYGLSHTYMWMVNVDEMMTNAPHRPIQQIS